MAHFAKVENGVVTQVIVADQGFIDALQDSQSWIQTSYNTYGNQHPEGRPMRKNFAGVGFTYDEHRDAFIPPQPFPSWVLNEESCLWEPPTPMPDDGQFYTWDEGITSWILVETGEDE